MASQHPAHQRATPEQLQRALGELRARSTGWPSQVSELPADSLRARVLLFAAVAMARGRSFRKATPPTSTPRQPRPALPLGLDHKRAAAGERADD